MKTNPIYPKRETCEDYNKGYCEFYSDECFHDNTILERNEYRCYRLIPRNKDEFMSWMGELCSDCNEAICNDCDMYKNHRRVKQLYENKEMSELRE